MFLTSILFLYRRHRIAMFFIEGLKQLLEQNSSVNLSPMFSQIGSWRLIPVSAPNSLVYFAIHVTLASTEVILHTINRNMMMYLFNFFVL